MGLSYRRGVGELMYDMITYHPDLSFAVVKLVQFSACPSEKKCPGPLTLLEDTSSNVKGHGHFFSEGQALNCTSLTTANERSGW